jgi:hypothetical protein
MIIELHSLKEIREKYERAFGLHNDLSEFEIRLSDKDLHLSGHVFVARRYSKIMHITAETECTPAAFLKRTGVGYDETLLQIIVDTRDLRIDSCANLFAHWIVMDEPEEVVKRLAKAF